MKTRFIPFIICAACLVSCEKYDWLGVFKGQSPEVNKRFETYVEYDKTHPIPDINSSKDEYSFAALTDIHAQDDLSSLNFFVSDCRNRPELEHFVLFLGDMCNGKDRFGKVSDALSPISKDGWNFFTVTGNHDLYFNQWEAYTKYWPSSAYCFRVKTPSAGTDLFIAFDSAEGTVGTKQRAWLEEVLKEAADDNYRNIIMFTHTNFFAKDRTQGLSGNMPLEETADLMNLFSKYSVGYVLCGHDHYYEKAEFRSVTYYTLNSFSANNPKHSYYCFTLGKELNFNEITF